MDIAAVFECRIIVILAPFRCVTHLLTAKSRLFSRLILKKYPIPIKVPVNLAFLRSTGGYFHVRISML